MEAVHQFLYAAAPGQPGIAAGGIQGGIFKALIKDDQLIERVYFFSVEQDRGAVEDGIALVEGPEQEEVSIFITQFRRRAGELEFAGAGVVPRQAKVAFAEPEAGFAGGEEIGILHHHSLSEGNGVIAEIELAQIHRTQLAIFQAQVNLQVGDLRKADVAGQARLAQRAPVRYPEFEIRPPTADQSGVNIRIIVGANVRQVPDAGAGDIAFLGQERGVAHSGQQGAMKFPGGSGFLKRDKITGIAVAEVGEIGGIAQVAQTGDAPALVAVVDDRGGIDRGYALQVEQLVQAHLVDVHRRKRLLDPGVDQGLIRTLISPPAVELVIKFLQPFLPLGAFHVRLDADQWLQFEQQRLIDPLDLP